MLGTHTSKRRIFTFALIAIVAAAAAYSGWYSINRHFRVAQNVACDYALAHPEPPVMMTAPDGSSQPVQILTGCAISVVPPSLLDLIRGRITFEGIPKRMSVHPYTLIDILTAHYTLSPAISACDQSATTTDCSTLLSSSSASQEPPATTTVKKIGNFLFEYPSDGFVSGFGWEQAAIPGAYNVTIPTLNQSGERHVYIFTDPSASPELTGLNPSAQTLDDYLIDYPIGASGTHQILVNGKPTTVEIHPIVRILSSENVTINGIPMLKQRYSAGYWSLDPKGNRIFDTSIEGSINDELRFVFNDGTSFVAITGWQADPQIEKIVRSVRLP